MINYFKKLSNVKKLAVYLGSSVVTGAVDAGLVPVRYEHYVQLTLFFLTAIGIYAARNVKPSIAGVLEAATEAAAEQAPVPVPASPPAVLGPPTAPLPALPVTLQS